MNAILVLFFIPIVIYMMNRNLMLSHVVNAFVFVIVLANLQHYDLSFPIYMIVTTIIFIAHYKKITFENKVYSIIYIGYMIIMLINSLYINYDNYQDILAVFFTNLIFPIFYLYLRNTNNQLKIKTNFLTYLICLVSLVDLVFSLVLITSSPTHQAIINSQPIGGGLAIAFLPFLIYLYSEKDSNKLILFINTIIFGICVVFSGLRGYLLIFYITMLVSLVVHLKSIINILWRKMYLVSMFLIGITIIFFMYGNIISNIMSSQLRLGNPLGRRTFENQYVQKIIEERSLIQNLFGQGIGMKMKNIKSVYDLDFYTNNSDIYYLDYEYRTLTLNECISFHNTWTTIIISIGFIGLILYLCFFLILIKDIINCNAYTTQNRIILVTYVVTIAIALIYRETLFRSVLEFISLYFALNIKKHLVKEEI